MDNFALSPHFAESHVQFLRHTNAVRFNFVCMDSICRNLLVRSLKEWIFHFFAVFALCKVHCSVFDPKLVLIILTSAQDLLELHRQGVTLNGH